jgi:glycosyltransferase involved in cell wall biosynthesis
MKILFVVDARSPIALNWIRYFAGRGDEIYIASTFACLVDLPVNELEITPVAFSAFKKPSQRPGSTSSWMLRLSSAQAMGLRTIIRQWFGPLTIRQASKRLRAFIERVKPDLIHAMRIPYEGMLASQALEAMKETVKAPLIVSSWGNDFTLHAPSTRFMSQHTRRAMQLTDAFHADCHRDVRLAQEWGLAFLKPTLVVPGNGGIRTDIFFPNSKPVDKPVIINPRGFRPYVRNDIFFKAIPLVLAKQPNAQFICASMAGESQAQEWIRDLNIDHAVELLPSLPHHEMAIAFRRAQIVVSPSIHDGTPNTLIEGMACGCFPLAGDLESIREWITPNENGLLFDSNHPGSIADAIVTAIENKELRNKAASLNQEIIVSRAEYKNNMKRVEEFYTNVSGCIGKQVDK